MLGHHVLGAWSDLQLTIEYPPNTNQGALVADSIVFSRQEGTWCEPRAAPQRCSRTTPSSKHWQLDLLGSDGSRSGDWPQSPRAREPEDLPTPAPFW